MSACMMPSSSEWNSPPNIPLTTAIGSRYSAASASGMASRGLANQTPTRETISPHSNPIRPPSEESVRLSMHRAVSAQHVVTRLEVDHHLRQRIGGHRELARRGGFDEQAGTEVEWRCWHEAPANLLGVANRWRRDRGPRGRSGEWRQRDRRGGRCCRPRC